jgi:hypothetical protein
VTDWPAWYMPSDAANADVIVREMTDAAWTHRETCPTCQKHHPCSELHGLIADAEGRIRVIGEKAFARYVEHLERKYATREP